MGSGSEGGDLGWFTPDRMLPSFSAAVIALEKNGTFTKQPVQTQFGYHVILLDDSRSLYQPATWPDCSLEKGMNVIWVSYGLLSERPAYISIGRDDSLVEIQIMGSKEEVLMQVEPLTAKYGKPTKTSEQVTNRLGAKFDNEIFTWTDSRGSLITVESVYSKVDEGRIFIESAKSVAAKKSAEKSLIQVGKQNL